MIRRTTSISRCTRLHRVALGTLAALALGAPLLTSGCNWVAAGFLLVHGPPRIEARHELQKERTTVIFVDDRANQLPTRALRDVIARSAQETLLAEGAIINVVDCKAAFSAVASEKSSEPMDLVALAKAVQAEVLVYAAVESFTLSEDGGSVSPSIAMRVKVMDATLGKRVWPEEKPGSSVVSTSRTGSGFTPTSRSDMAKMEQEAAKQAGVALAQVFFSHERESSGLKSQ
ncbi:MAG: hypothetical protein U0638_03295 [Phycisphaerales bacterium]